MCLFCIGRTNDLTKYHINWSDLPDATEIKDLGIFIDSNLKYSHHINNIFNVAKQRSSLILKCFVSRKPELLFKAFVTDVRPLFEYNSQIWSPSSILDIKKIESVQRAFQSDWQVSDSCLTLNDLVVLTLNPLNYVGLKVIYWCILKLYINLLKYTPIHFFIFSNKTLCKPEITAVR